MQNQIVSSVGNFIHLLTFDEPIVNNSSLVHLNLKKVTMRFSSKIPNNISYS